MRRMREALAALLAVNHAPRIFWAEAVVDRD